MPDIVLRAVFHCRPCRFLVRLLMVHGGLSVYRISRLIKYSFYKNIAFAFMLLYYQFFSGWSGALLLPPHLMTVPTPVLT